MDVEGVAPLHIKVPAGLFEQVLVGDKPGTQSHWATGIYTGEITFLLGSDCVQSQCNKYYNQRGESYNPNNLLTTLELK